MFWTLIPHFVLSPWLVKMMMIGMMHDKVIANLSSLINTFVTFFLFLMFVFFSHLCVVSQTSPTKLNVHMKWHAQCSHEVACSMFWTHSPLSVFAWSNTYTYDSPFYCYRQDCYLASMQALFSLSLLSSLTLQAPSLSKWPPHTSDIYSYSG